MEDVETADAFVEGTETAGVDRRTFVRRAAATAGLAALGASGMGMFRQVAVLEDMIVRQVDYVGVRVLAGSPAPRGLPLVPLAVNADGFVEGVPETDGENHLDWYRYCGHESAPGLRPGGTSDNVLRYFLNEEKLITADDAQREAWWYRDRIGEPVHVDEWSNRPYGTGAAVQWRSVGETGDDIVTALVLKLDPDAFTGKVRDQLPRFMDMDHHLLGVSTYCTHLCCVPGWKEDQAASRLGFWDMIFCTCHNSRFDPRELETYTFTMRAPRDVA